VEKPELSFQSIMGKFELVPASKINLDEAFTPTRNGELFVYLNKPALGFWPNAFYNLNSGMAKVTVIPAGAGLGQ
jgi:hypothetical protein